MFTGFEEEEGKDGTGSSLEKLYLHMESVLDIFIDRVSEIQALFGRRPSVIHGVWHHAEQPFKDTMRTSLLQKVKYLSMYGQNIIG